LIGGDHRSGQRCRDSGDTACVEQGRGAEGLRWRRGLQDPTAAPELPRLRDGPHGALQPPATRRPTKAHHLPM